MSTATKTLEDAARRSRARRSSSAAPTTARSPRACSRRCSARRGKGWLAAPARRSPAACAFWLVSLVDDGVRRHRRLGQQHPGRAGPSTSPTSSGGSASATPARSSRAILLLFQQKWRTSINRFAEAMTLFAVAHGRACSRSSTSAAPGSSAGSSRTPRRRSVWPNFKSALPWDVFAISTYFTVSFLFWYLGLIPDLATLRDAREEPDAGASSTASSSLGWRGSARHWQHYRVGYLLLAGLSTPLVRLGPHHRVLRLRHLAAARAGTRPSSRPTSSPARSSAASRWC